MITKTILSERLRIRAKLKSPMRHFALLCEAADTFDNMLDDLEKCLEVIGEGNLFGIELKRNIDRYKGE